MPRTSGRHRRGHEIRNVFDQYSQQENRLSHALAFCLAEDPWLTQHFLRKVIGIHSRGRGPFAVTEQRLPGELEESERESERRGLPDICILDSQNNILALESKLESALTRDQLSRHRRTLERRGFSNVRVVALTAGGREEQLGAAFQRIPWARVYEWASRATTRSPWAGKLTDYMETLERRLVEEEYLKTASLTRFPGVRFDADNPYTRQEAKRLLRLAMDEIRTRNVLARQLDADLSASRHPGQWDLIPFKAARKAEKFTEYPHLSFGVARDHLRASVIVPHGVRSSIRRRLTDLEWEPFQKLMATTSKGIMKALRGIDGSTPYLSAYQRHWVTRRSPAITDALVEMDLRTYFGSSHRVKTGPRVKHQPEWLEAVYRAFVGKRSNIELSLGVKYNYQRCPLVRSRKILDSVAESWVACKPFLKTLLS